MKNIFKIERDENNIVKWETPQQRFAFVFKTVSFIIFAPIIFFTFIWVFYWIFTGKNIFYFWLEL